MDPKDFILPSYLVDATRFNTVISSAVTQAAITPNVGIASAIQASSAMRDILHPSSTLLGAQTVSPAYLGSAYSSLATLRQPYDVLGSTAAYPYASTVNSLASAAYLGAGVRDLIANTVVSPTAFAATTVPLGSAAFQVGVSDNLRLASGVASPYLASSATVFSLETSYAKMLGAAGLVAGVPVAGSFVNSLHSNVLGISGALRSTWELVQSDVAIMTTGSVAMLRSPAIELYTATQAAAVFSLPAADYPATGDEIETILDEAVDDFESRLGSLHQGLVEAYKGGIDALNAGGRDWRRHVMVSFRELSTHVLHLLAPDEKLIPSAAPGDLHNGKPTRRARLNFIFNDVAGPAIAKFYEADMKAAIELFDLLNDGTHRLEQSATSEQAHYIRGRVVGLITAVLEASGY